MNKFSKKIFSEASGKKKASFGKEKEWKNSSQINKLENKIEKSDLKEKRKGKINKVENYQIKRVWYRRFSAIHHFSPGLEYRVKAIRIKHNCISLLIKLPL